MSETPANPKILALDMRDVTVASLKNPTVIVAEGVNWTVKPGEFWVVGSPQHSGKTDFLMMVSGMSSPMGGEYHFLGEAMPIFEESRMAHRLKLGFVFDGGQLLGQLTVAENIALPLRYHGRLSSDEIESRVRELLEITELMSWANSTPANVGRSWRQRAGLARALTLQPEVLLLDSPLTGLDARHVAWWLGLLDKLSRGDSDLGGKPVTLVVTADDLRPWRKHAGQVGCLSNRRLIVLGDWRAVENSKEKVVQELLGE
jgi:ABC-type transporter Mla maintaining outer membrane lipid asymmetry ATPase subunit MlaF